MEKYLKEKLQIEEGIRVLAEYEREDRIRELNEEYNIL